MGENSLDNFSTDYLSKLDEYENNLNGNITDFLISDLKKCLLIETSSTRWIVIQVRQLLEKLKTDAEDGKNSNNYLAPENQTFLNWDYLQAFKNLPTSLPEFKNLLVCEIPKKCIVNYDIMVMATEIIDRIIASSSKKVIFVIAGRGLLDKYLKNIEIKAFLKIDDYDEHVTRTVYADNNEALIECASRGRYSDVEELLLEKTVNINAIDNNLLKQTALHRALQNGYDDVALLLLQKGAKLKVDGRGNTPLHWAIKNRRKKAFLMLLENISDVDISGSSGNTALMTAANLGDKELVDLLLDKGANVCAKNKVGYTPLHFAAQNNHIEVLNTLISHGAEIDAQDENQETPLHKAAQNNHTEVISALLNQGADINFKDKLKYTPLHEASRKGHTKTVKLLVEKGADVNVKNRNGETPLDIAVFRQDIRMAAILRAVGKE